MICHLGEGVALVKFILPPLFFLFLQNSARISPQEIWSSTKPLLFVSVCSNQHSPGLPWMQPKEAGAGSESCWKTISLLLDVGETPLRSLSLWCWIPQQQQRHFYLLIMGGQMRVGILCCHDADVIPQNSNFCEEFLFSPSTDFSFLHFTITYF